MKNQRISNVYSANAYIYLFFDISYSTKNTFDVLLVSDFRVIVCGILNEFR